MKEKLLAQAVNISGQPINGPLIDPIRNQPVTTVAGVINIVIPFVAAVASIVLFLILIWGGYDFMLSRGSPEKLKSARAKITSAIIGFILIVLAYLMTRLVSQMFGLGQDLFL